MHRLGQPTEPSVIHDEERAIDLRTSARRDFEMKRATGAVK